MKGENVFILRERLVDRCSHSIVAGKKVAIFDFTWEPPILRTMLAEASKLIVIDHHKSALQMLAG